MRTSSLVHSIQDLMDDSAATSIQTPAVVMVGTTPHTIKGVRLEYHEDDRSYTLWIEAEEA